VLNCIIVDDEFGAIEVLSKFVNKTPFLELKCTFRDPVVAIDYLLKEEVDLVFLDINMPNLNGIQFVDTLNKPTMIIFCTAYKEFALESYEKNAIDYLLKPVEYNRFLSASSKALKFSKKYSGNGSNTSSEEKNENIVIKSGSKLHLLKYEQIIFLEKETHYVKFQTMKNSLLSRMSMNEAINVLPKEKFARVHRSFIVAIDHIDTIESHQLRIGSYKIPIGKKYKSDFFKMFKPKGQ
jgi:DNA-binding LytR/AlgR family response regulator